MKTSLLFFFLLVLALPVNAQNDLYSGGWVTPNTSKLTTITGSNNLPQRIYRIECTLFQDADVLQFNIIVDGTTIPATFFEGNYVIVEGKKIVIQQLNAGKCAKGSWKVIQQPEVLAEKTTWSGYPQIQKDILIASLKTEQEFVISLNSTSTDCQNTSMSIFIDSVPVTATGAGGSSTSTFAGGSSIVGFGKLVTARVVGTCASPTASINGDFKLLKK
jgi:hypothetical protein